MTREELQRLYDQCVSRAFRAEQLAGLVRGVESFLAEPDPTVEIAYLKAKLADVEAGRDQLEASTALVRQEHVAKPGQERLPNGVSTPWNRCACGFHSHDSCPTVRALGGA